MKGCEKMNYTKTLILLILATLLLNINQTSASNNYQTFTFEKNKLKIDKFDGYDFIKYEEFELSQIIAAPQLPVKIIQLALPAGKEIAAISVKIIESEYLDGEYYPFPAQPAQILSGSINQFVEPDQNIYSSSDLFPKEIVRIDRHGYLSGYNIGALLVYPVQYLPSEKKLLFISKMEVEITYKESQRLPLPFKTSEYSEHIQRQALQKIVKNPQSLTRSSQDNIQTAGKMFSEEHRYVIITADDLVANFQPLADWKTKKGLSAAIITTSYISANFSGNNEVEKIRNFIIYAYQNWGTVWVLLGGDTNIIPVRKAFAFDCEYGSFSDNYLPCDLYFSDLDGNWNANGNATYGEVEDNIDMYSDVFVGRAPVENADETDAFVNKILTYEKNPPNGHELDMLFLAEILWKDPYTNSGDGKDHIDSLYVPDRFDPITKLYEALKNESKATANAALNAGQNIVNHDGHAGTTVMCVGDGSLYRGDMDALTNGPKYSILYSIGCWPAAFDYDCIAEHFVTNPNGGGVAFIGNSRYGWGSPGNPLYGYSDRFDQQFFKQLFTKNIYHIGNTLSAAKSVYVPFSSQENVYRWCQYEINLLGDPEMPIWTDTPKALTVAYPQELPLGDSFCRVTVTDGGSPIEGALICLMQDTVVYATAFTGNDGRAGFNISTINPAENIHVTVTAQNFIPFENTISLFSDQPYVQISSYSTNGSIKGLVTPGDTVSMEACFKNFGNKTGYEISGILSTENENIIMIDSTESTGNVLAGDSINIANAFSFQVSSNLKNGEVIYLNSQVSDSSGNVWTNLLSLTGATPALSYLYHNLSDSMYGDGDGFAESGESVNLDLIIKNTGLKSAQNVSVTLSSSSPYLSFTNPNLNYGAILPSDYSQSSTEIIIDAGCPQPSFPQIDLFIETQDGYQFTDTFSISIGEMGLFDDMENGDGNWTHSGAVDLWHITANRKHSGDSSWYCGNEGQFVYDNNMQNNYLESISFVIGQNAQLSFWCWYEFPNYGTNGLYVEVNDGGGWKVFDFIGSGGALGALPTGNDWLEYKYDLSDYPAGTSLTLRFRFQSDDETVTEGVYIDDVKIQQKETGPSTAAPSIKNNLKNYTLYQNYPNPFNPATTIKFTLEKPESVNIKIYDIKGALIRELMNKKANAGSNKIVWDGKNEHGNIVTSGIYFYRISAGKFSKTKRMVFIR